MPRRQRKSYSKRQKNSNSSKFIHLIALLILLPIISYLTFQSTEFRQRAQALDKPDIILFITDDMREADWSVLKQTKRVINGTFFPYFVYNNPLCCPTRATLLTGQYSHNNGVISNSPGWYDFQKHEADSLGPALNQVGYHTVYIGKYLNPYDGSKIPPGWDRWLGHLSPGWKPERKFFDDAVGLMAAKEIAAAPKNQPLFLVAGFRSPHDPHTPAERYINADVGPVKNEEDAGRRRELLSVDDAVAEIATAMGPRWKNACVFFLSDNGYLLGEHGYRGKATWWDQATRVPLLARCNGISGSRDERLAATIDIAPTILRAAGAQLKRIVDGRALQDAWDREGVLVESYVGGVSGDKFRAIKGKTWIYVVPEGEAPRYYELPGETTNTISGRSEGELSNYANWLSPLLTCRGKSCRQNEQAP